VYYYYGTTRYDPLMRDHGVTVNFVHPQWIRWGWSRGEIAPECGQFFFNSCLDGRSSAIELFLLFGCVGTFEHVCSCD
jgi:hypothetical protein